MHHAGLLPKYRVLVEQLAQRGLLKVICGTDTLGVGINVPIRTVLFTRLCKFDGQKTAVLSARDFHQIAGRAGRKGFDDRGFVVAQAPEHVIENLKLDEKAKGGKKVVKRKPPEHNFANWDLQTFKRLMGAPPERLTSRFDVSHGMLLNVLSRRGDGCRAMQGLIRDSHETDHAKRAHFRRAWQLFRALVERGIVEIVPRTEDGSRVRVNVDLQEDFSMNHALSLYLLETIPLLEADSETHALDLLTLVESILENPELILRRQLDKLKGRKVAEMKAEGLDYDQRMAELEKMEYPKPLRDFVYMTFNAFADRHPWVGEENIRPKSIAREMFEGFRSFSDYVQEYDLERAEGLLLRHLNSVYKVLSQTVPDGVKTDAILEMELYLRDMLRQVDSSLLDEWERMRDPNYQPPGTGGDGSAAAAAGGAAGRHARRQGLHRRHPHARLRVPARLVDRRRRGRAGRPRLTRRRQRRAVDGRATARGARGLSRRARRRPPPRPRGPQPPPHLRPSRRRRDRVARAADARGPGGPERLGGRARGGPRRLARDGRAGGAAVAPGEPVPRGAGRGVRLEASGFRSVFLRSGPVFGSSWNNLEENPGYLSGAVRSGGVSRGDLHSALRNPSAGGGTQRILNVGYVESDDWGAASIAAIEAAANALLAAGARVLSVGGDHSVTYPLVRAYARQYPGLSLLHFDAHPDLYDDFEGNRFSHASPFARIMEERLAVRLLSGRHPDPEPAPARAGASLRRRDDPDEGLAVRRRVLVRGPRLPDVRSRRAGSGVRAGCLASRAGWAERAGCARRLVFRSSDLAGRGPTWWS